MRTPTEKQFQKLRILAIGVAGLSWSKREAEPLLRHGWITADFDGKFYQWVQISPDGLRALALAVERYGLPRMEKGRREVKVCSDCQREWQGACRSCGGRTCYYRQDEVERADVAA